MLLILVSSLFLNAVLLLIVFLKRNSLRKEKKKNFLMYQRLLGEEKERNQKREWNDFWTYQDMVKRWWPYFMKKENKKK